MGATISCVSASFYMVSDSVGDIIQYSGGSWGQAQQIDQNRLMSVSCSSTSSCVAVDYDGNVMAYNGSSWT